MYYFAIDAFFATELNLKGMSQTKYQLPSLAFCIRSRIVLFFRPGGLSVESKNMPVINCIRDTFTKLRTELFGLAPVVFNNNNCILFAK